MPPEVKVGVVTDSTADIPTELLASHAIEMVPALLIIDGETFEDGLQLSRSDFYKMMPAFNHPATTATPSPAAFEAAYQRTFERGVDQILSIHVASTLSGICTSANQAAMQFPGKVRVMDSGQLSLGLGFQVIEAAEAARAGGSFERVLAVADEAKKNARVAALINTLEYLKRSGRVNWLQAGIGQMLRIKQLLGVQDGTIEDLGKTRTFERAQADLLEIFNAWGTCIRLAVLHTGVPELAEQLARKLDARSQQAPLIVEVTTIIGAHVGPGSIGLAALTT